MAALALILGALGACTPTAQDIAYPDLGRTAVKPTPAGLLTPAERDAAIEEMRQEARGNAGRGL